MNLTTETGFTITDVLWYTPITGECIGIVTGKSAEGELKRYIGVGFGVDEDSDALDIARHGAKFYGPYRSENA
jgi:hypothetical protein